MKIERTIQIERPAEHVWQIVGNEFADGGQWMSPIARSYATDAAGGLDGAPVAGRVCELSDDPNGTKVEEPITKFDARARIIEFDVNPVNAPAAFPVRKNRISINVRKLGPDRSEVTWIARPVLKPFAYLLYPVVFFVLGRLFGKVLTDLKTHAEGREVDAAVAPFGAGAA